MPVLEIRHPLIRHKIGLMRRHDISTKNFRELAQEVGALLTYEATNGNIRQRPEAAIATRALAEVRQFCQEFGLTPSARARFTRSWARTGRASLRSSR